MNKYIEFGKIKGTHGLKGELELECFFQNVEHFLNAGIFLKENEDNFIKINARKTGRKKDVTILKFNGIEKIEDATQLIKKTIFVERSALEELSDGNQETHFVFDLIGLRVLIEGNSVEYGKVTDVVDFGSGALLEVKLNLEGNEKLEEYLPKNPEVVKEVNLKEGFILINKNFKDL